MNGRSLLPDEPEPLRPDPTRIEPTVWIRRLVILDERRPDAAPLREVTFRRGLNIIRTEPTPADAKMPAGHSVGKTLLTRLIRYCLGEDRFAPLEQQSAIAEVLPTGWVVCEFVVAGECWVVGRPLNRIDQQPLTAIRSGDWRAWLAGQPGRFSDFTNAVETAVWAGINPVRLPHAGREATWRDVLGWLARDHECRYRVFNEWRDPDAESGTAKLARDDASILIRGILGLLDPLQEPLRRQLEQTLGESRECERKIVAATSRIETLRELLARNPDIADSQLTDRLFVKSLQDKLEESLASLRRALEDRRRNPEVNRLLEAMLAAAKAVAAVEAEVKQLRNMLNTARGLHETKQKSAEEVPTDPFDPRRNCPKDGCPFVNARLPDPQHVADLTESLAAIEGFAVQIGTKDEQLPRLRQDAQAASARYQEEVDGASEESLGYQRKIWEFEAQLKAMADYVADLDARQKLIESKGRVEVKAKKARADIRAGDSLLDARRFPIAEHYRRTLRLLLGPTADGDILVDSSGVRPVPSRDMGAKGAALSTLTTVLALDLTCMAASIAGHGSHPRLLIHDSPHEAEVEPNVYGRLFETALDWDRCFSEGNASFQYIVTTTTPPPMSADATPFVRLVLDARSDDGLLLRRRYRP